MSIPKAPTQTDIFKGTEIMENAIKNFISENTPQMYEMLKTLCGIPAPSHFEHERAKWCKEWLEAAGAEGVYIDEAQNVIFPLYCEGSKDITVFASHTDTVFPDVEPMPYYDDGEKVHCPGAADDTASVVVLLLLAKFCVQNKITPPGGFLFVCNSAEEGLGNLKGVKQLFDEYDGRISAFLSFDSSLYVVNDRCVGSHRYEVEVSTEGGHSFQAFGLPNAIAVLSSMIAKIYEIKVPVKAGARTTYNVGTVTGGTSVNTIAQSAKMLCEYRSDDKDCLAYMQDQFARIFRAAEADGVKITVKQVGDRPCSSVDEAAVSRLKDAVVPVIESVLGESVSFISASTDCNIPLSKGVPAICIGVNEYYGVHTREEWVDKASMVTGLEIAIKAAEALLSLKQITRLKRTKGKTMKQAIMYGAGNIGRGFIGQLFHMSGYEISFIDVNMAVVDQLNTDGQYPVYITAGEGYEEYLVTGVHGVNGRDNEAIAEAIASSDIMATAVGVNILKFIAAPFAGGVRRRMEKGIDAPLNVIICENMIEADKYFASLVKENLNEEEKAYFDTHIALIEPSIGRMVPATPKEIAEKNPLAVCVEPYCELPVDKNAFKGEIPEIKNMVPFAPFDFFIRRKLFMHNMSHALTAYFGARKGYTYIWEAAKDAEVKLMTLRALTESSRALSKEYGVPLEELILFSENLIGRFENKLLGDTIERVGRDTKRKLSENDRFVGAARLCLKHGIRPMNIAAGLAAGLTFAPAGDDASAEVVKDVKENGLLHALNTYCGVEETSPIVPTVKDVYARLESGAPMAEIISSLQVY